LKFGGSAWRLASFSRTHRQRLEPISKSFEEDHEAGELDEAEEVLAVVLPADEDAALPLDPGEGAYVPCARTRHVWGQGKAVGCVPPTALLFVEAHFTKKIGPPITAAPSLGCTADRSDGAGLGKQ